jgi:hypothetical protein
MDQEWGTRKGGFMRGLLLVTLFCSVATGWAATIVDTGPPDGQLAIESGSRVGLAGSEFSAADDFIVNSATLITGGNFTGIQGSPLAALFDFSSVQVSVYTVSNPNPIPAVLLDTRSSLSGQLVFTQPLPGTPITVPTSIGLTGLPGGSVEGPLETVPFQLLDPIILPAGHYFFSAQVATTCDFPICASFPPSPSQGYFFWLSAPFPQGGSDVPATFMGNATVPPQLWVSTASNDLSFSLTGQTIPEPGTAWFIVPAFVLLTYIARPSLRLFRRGVE